MELHFSDADLYEHAVAEVIGQPELQALAVKRPLVVKFGIDPTSPSIHLGRSIPLWRLRAFQELGHEIHLIIGDYTGQIGDTSDKDAERPVLAPETVRENMTRYEEQLWLILNPDRKDQVKFYRNSTWLEPLTLAQISRMADAFSVNAFVKRELIADRLERGSRVSLREMLYPLMQGYDSVQLKADVEIGGTDQRFNLLAGRALQEQAGQPAQAIIMNHLIAGTDGRKMSSSWGNVIALLDSPVDKFGKLMRISDDLMADYLLVLPSAAQPFSAATLSERLAAGENPRDLKLAIARSLVTLYHGEVTARETEAQFLAQFSEGKQPEAMASYAAPAGSTGLAELMVAAGVAPTRSEARRLISQGGVRLDGTAVSDPFVSVTVSTSMVLSVGKRQYVRLTPTAV